MTVPETTAPASTAVATQTERTAAVRERIEVTRAELKERNLMVAAIRGTQWGKDCGEKVQRAVAHYCLTNGLDPVRHVEILGGRIYLTANFYDERGLPFIVDGTIKMNEPDNVTNDPRLVELMKSDDKEQAVWAAQEHRRRQQVRILRGIPDAATGAFVTSGTVNDSPIVGFNWCGGGTKQKIGKGGVKYDADPIGDKDPILTAQTRSRRRFWVQAVAALGPRAQEVMAVQASAKVVDEEIVTELLASAEDPRASRALLAGESVAIVDGAEEVPVAVIREQGVEPYAEGEEAPLAGTRPAHIAQLMAQRASGKISDDDAKELRQWELDHE